MKSTIKNTLMVMLAMLALSACKKDEDTAMPVNKPSETEKELNGYLKGKVTGFTKVDSTAFEYDFLHPYEETIQNSSVLSKNLDGSYDIFVERSKHLNFSNDAYSYIEIDDWDLSEDLKDSDAYIELYVEQFVPLGDGKTLYNYSYAFDSDEITIEYASLNPETGEFKIKLTGEFEENNGENGITENPGSITIEYEGKLYPQTLIDNNF